jgi:hypothetical protein
MTAIPRRSTVEVAAGSATSTSIAPTGPSISSVFALKGGIQKIGKLVRPVIRIPGTKALTKFEAAPKS